VISIDTKKKELIGDFENGGRIWCLEVDAVNVHDFRQDELLLWFGEPFDIIFSALDQQQLVNPWQRSSPVIASLDYAKQEGYGRGCGSSDGIRSSSTSPTSARRTPAKDGSCS
jgi:hypothetical protein